MCAVSSDLPCITGEEVKKTDEETAALKAAGDLASPAPTAIKEGDLVLCCVLSAFVINAANHTLSFATCTDFICLYATSSTAMTLHPLNLYR